MEHITFGQKFSNFTPRTHPTYQNLSIPELVPWVILRKSVLDPKTPNKFCKEFRIDIVAVGHTLTIHLTICLVTVQSTYELAYRQFRFIPAYPSSSFMFLVFSCILFPLNFQWCDVTHLYSNNDIIIIISI